jgi:uncharacterized Tic20 family protein
LKEESRVVETVKRNEHTWGMLCHLAALAGYVIPLGNIVGPLVVWLIKKDEYPFVDEQGKSSLNFQISMLIYEIVSIILSLILIGFILLIALLIVNLVCVILAAVHANDGKSFRYPLSITFLR